MTSLTVDALARQIHGVWRRTREREGWRLGAADVHAKTSPYLKPLSAFSDQEWRRERWLALADLLTIADSPQRDLSALSIDGEALRAPSLDDAMAARVHHAWGAINLYLGVERDYADFAALSPAAQALCRANVACDIEAIAALELSGATITVHACADMHADADLLRQIFAPASSDALR